MSCGESNQEADQRQQVEDAIKAEDAEQASELEKEAQPLLDSLAKEVPEQPKVDGIDPLKGDPPNL